MSRVLHVLLVEDSDADAHLIVAELRRHAPDLCCVRVEDEASLRAQLETQGWDVIIADYRLPQFSAARALQIVKEQSLDIPFIIVSGTIGEDVAVGAMKAGAHDYVMKGKLARLVPAVERELRDAEVRRARTRAEEEARFQANLLGAVGQAVVATDREGKITYWNHPAENLYGWSSAEALGQNLKGLILPEDSRDGGADSQGELLQGRNWVGEMIIRRRDGVSLTARVTNAPVYNAAGEMDGMIQVSADVTERIAAEHELQSSRAQLRALAARLQSVREAERKCLSRDIHDELGQVLTCLKMELAWMRTRLAGDRAVPRAALLEKIAALGLQIDASAQGIRKLCAELRPGILDDLGLAAAIEWQAREFSKRTGIACQVSCEAESLPLDPDSNTAVFRIFQEILTNVARHARATSVTVALTTQPDRLILEACDNGRGIQPADLSPTKSLGLLGMRERAMALGGNIEFVRGESVGTRVKLSLPFERLVPPHAELPSVKTVAGRPAKTP